jgi:uncharacterized protein (TIGR02118 family)
MIKLTFCLRRKPGLSWDEFSTYWREVHAPLVKSHAKALGVRRYVQLRTLQDREQMARMQARNNGSPEPFDGVAELWFDDQPVPRSPEGKAGAIALLEDERRFIDLPASPMWMSHEWEVISNCHAGPDRNGVE